MDNKYAIEMNHITMRFGSIIANDNINLKVQKGSIHAIVGENGAGKSTLMSILFGIYKPTTGYIKINEKAVVIKDPNHANKLELGMVHQHFKLVGIYNAVENIILGNEPKKLNFLQLAKAKKKIQDLAKKYYLDINLKIKVKDMSVGMQQRVEILKILYSDASILIFDEPTAVLTPQEIQGFLKLLLDFKQKGKTIILITHKLDEVKAVADKSTVLRKGKNVGEFNVKTTSIKRIATAMVGRNIVAVKNKAKIKFDKNILEIKNLNVLKSNRKKHALKNINFSIKEGEILAIAGVEGNGQSELAQAIAGLIKINSGKILLQNKNIENLNIRERYNSGLSFVPEDRHKHGLVLDMSINENISNRLFYKKSYSKYGIINNNQIMIFSNDVINNFDVRGSDQGKNFARSLSGGNQQKAIVGREMSIDHNLLIAVQPTRGLDIGAIEYIHSKILDDKKNKKAVLLISYELEEILSLADRILVINDGQITGELLKQNANREKIGQLMTRKGK